MSALKEMIKKIGEECHGFAPSRVHRLLELCMTITGRGEVGDDYVKAISFPIGNISIYSDPYYNQVTVYSEDDVEMDLENNEINKLADELKKRIMSFERKIRKRRKEVSDDVFDRPVDFISFDE